MNQNELKLFLDKHNIKDISTDSRNIKKGSIFFAIKGYKYNGEDYIKDAIKSGARIIFTSNKKLAKDNIYYFKDINKILRDSLNYLYPNLPYCLAAVTGTNGKSSVVNFYNQICNKLLLKSASIGTLGVESKNIELTNLDVNSTLTTPDTISLRKIINFLSLKGCKHIALEASSIGIDQGRLDGLKFDIAAFTSFSMDHLDYHKNFDNYLNAKLKLFTNHLKEDSKIVLNNRLYRFQEIYSHIINKSKKIPIIIGKGGDIEIISIKINKFTKLSEVYVRYYKETYKFNTSINTRILIENLVMSMVLVSIKGAHFKEIAKSVSKINSINGRMEFINHKNLNFNKNIVIDYSHTPEALKIAINNLREFLKDSSNNNGRIITLFGCGGDRDKIKRPHMGKIAKSYSDIVIVTDDNPRNELPSEIRKDIIGDLKNIIEIASREEAIKYGISILKQGDILLLAGKGHEKFQILNDGIIEFDEKKIVNNLLDNNI